MANDPRFPRLKGFRDFLPEDLALRAHVFDAWRRVSRRYGFQEYDGPPLESLDLYREKSGEEIVEQLYHFRDKGDREVALRPEMTPSLARILGHHSRSMPKPIRWYSLPQLFRYERQQRGRLREHFQWNVDVVGEASVGADAEVLAVAIDGLRELGLGSDDFRARISDRALLSALLRAVGVEPDDTPGVFAAVDKLQREPAERVGQKLRSEIGLAPVVSERVLSLFQSPDLDEVMREYGDREDVADAVRELSECVAVLESLGLADFVEIDLSIVRGLAYYTGIVFELFDRRGELRAICGGGRYDRLLERVGGGESLPAVGFGMGDVVLSELLADLDLVPTYEPSVDLFVVAITGGERPLARRVAAVQRERGKSVGYALGEDSVKKQFSQASSLGARRVVVLGPDEVRRDRAVLREMESGEEEEVLLTSLGLPDGAGVER